MHVLYAARRHNRFTRANPCARHPRTIQHSVLISYVSSREVFPDAFTYFIFRFRVFVFVRWKEESARPLIFEVLFPSADPAGRSREASRRHPAGAERLQRVSHLSPRGPQRRRLARSDALGRTGVEGERPPSHEAAGDPVSQSLRQCLSSLHLRTVPSPRSVASTWSGT